MHSIFLHLSVILNHCTNRNRNLSVCFSKNFQWITIHSLATKDVPLLRKYLHYINKVLLTNCPLQHSWLVLEMKTCLLDSCNQNNTMRSLCFPRKFIVYISRKQCHYMEGKLKRNAADCFFLYHCPCLLSVDMTKHLQKERDKTTLEKEDTFWHII